MIQLAFILRGWYSELWLKNTGEGHTLIVTPCSISDGVRNFEVITEFEVKEDLTEYKATRIFEDYDDARDYVDNVKETLPSIKVEHDTVKICSRFSPDILHCGFTFLRLPR